MYIYIQIYQCIAKCTYIYIFIYENIMNYTYLTEYWTILNGNTSGLSQARMPHVTAAQWQWDQCQTVTKHTKPLTLLSQPLHPHQSAHCPDRTWAVLLFPQVFLMYEWFQCGWRCLKLQGNAMNPHGNLQRLRSDSTLLMTTSLDSCVYPT